MTHTTFRYLAGISHVFGWTLVATAQNQGPASARYRGATVSDWTGEVQVQPPGGALAAPTWQQALPPGTLPDTGDGRLLLRLEDETCSTIPARNVMASDRARLPVEQKHHL